MITIKTLKSGKKKISSSYFDDVKMLKKSLSETDFRGMRAEKGNIFDLETFSMENAIMQIMTWEKGCREVTNYVKDLNANQAADIETVYMGEDYDKAGFTGQGI